MMTRLCLFVMCFSLTLSALAYGQGPKKPRTLDDYRARTLQELGAMLPDTFRKALDESAARGQVTRTIVHGELFPSRVKVVYADMKRSLPDVKHTVISEWANGFAGAPEFYKRSYQTEKLFTEGNESYWMAVREDLLSSEWKKGEALELCVVKMGNALIDDKLEPVILIEQVVPIDAFSNW